MTNRQYLAWQEWLDEEWNRPNRTDQYLMQVACEVLRTRVKKPGRVKLDQMRIKFVKRGEKPRLTKEQATARSKAFWFAVARAPGPRPPGAK